MRFTKENASRAGKRSQQVQREKRISEPNDHVYPPMEDELLLIDRVTNPMQKCSVEYIIKQGRRQNQIKVFAFGRQVKSIHTWTKFFDLRRRRMSVKWLTV